MYNLLKGLENQNEVAWLVNQRVIQTGIGNGKPFEYSLNAIPADTIENEVNAVQAIFSGKSETEIMQILKSEYFPVRMKELQELQKAGHKFVFDEVNNSFIFARP